MAAVGRNTCLSLASGLLLAFPLAEPRLKLAGRRAGETSTASAIRPEEREQKGSRAERGKG